MNPNAQHGLSRSVGQSAEASGVRRVAEPFKPPQSEQTRPGSLKVRFGFTPWTCVGLAFAVWVLTIPLGMAAAHAAGPSSAIPVYGLGFSLSGLLALIGLLWGVVRGCVRLTRMGLEAFGINEVTSGALLGLVSLIMMVLGGVSAFLASVSFSRGRQLRKRGGVLLPPVRAGAAWVRAGNGTVLDGCESAPQGLAEQWRENGRTEHASVAAFARLTLDVMALGAPPSIVAAANLDALDEIRHTEACFGLASSLDGKLESPGPFPEAQAVATLPRSRTLALAKLAVTSLVDGALNEGVSARIAAKLSRRCRHAEMVKVLKQIAADEGRHAAHGWDVVEWCLQEGGTPVADALLGACRGIPERIRSVLPEAARDGGWEVWGIHGTALEDEEYAATRRHVVQRVRARCAERRQSDALTAL